MASAGVTRLPSSCSTGNHIMATKTWMIWKDEMAPFSYGDAINILEVVDLIAILFTYYGDRRCLSGGGRAYASRKQRARVRRETWELSTWVLSRVDLAYWSFTEEKNKMILLLLKCQFRPANIPWDVYKSDLLLTIRRSRKGKDNLDRNGLQGAFLKFIGEDHKTFRRRWGTRNLSLSCQHISFRSIFHRCSIEIRKWLQPQIQMWFQNSINLSKRKSTYHQRRVGLDILYSQT